MNLPQVYMCSPSWTLLPPPSPFHPSGSSQSTSPKHPVFVFWEIKHERFLSLPDSLYFENQPWALNYNHFIEIQRKRTNRDVSTNFFRCIFNSYFLKEGIGFWYFWGRKKTYSGHKHHNSSCSLPFTDPLRNPSIKKPAFSLSS